MCLSYKEKKKQLLFCVVKYIGNPILYLKGRVILKFYRHFIVSFQNNGRKSFSLLVTWLYNLLHESFLWTALIFFIGKLTQRELQWPVVYCLAGRSLFTKIHLWKMTRVQLIKNSIYLIAPIRILQYDDKHGSS